MTKFEIGDKVRILDAKGISCAVEEGYVSGDVTELIKTPGGNLGIVGRCGDYPVAIHGTEFDYIEKVAEHVTKKQRLSALEQQVAKLQAEVATLKQASKPKYTLNGLLAQAPKSPNEQRKAIIAEAKAFVDETSTFINTDFSWHNSPSRRHYDAGTLEVKFEVNAEKRTVVALVYLKYAGGLAFKAIAKCAPDDVFNADIGRAIALGRALGLDVKRFEQAVKPTEVVVGMKVRGIAFGAIYEVPAFHTGERMDGQYGRAIATQGVRSAAWVGTKQVTISDDTGAQY